MRLKRDSKGRFLPRGRRRAAPRRRRRRRSNPRGGFLGLPLWVWLLGGAAVVIYLATRKSAPALPASSTMSFPESIVEQPGETPPEGTSATWPPVGTGYYGYGRVPGGRPAGAYGLYRRF